MSTLCDFVCISCGSRLEDALTKDLRNMNCLAKVCQILVEEHCMKNLVFQTDSEKHGRTFMMSRLTLLTSYMCKFLYM